MNEHQKGEYPPIYTAPYKAPRNDCFTFYVLSPRSLIQSEAKSSQCLIQSLDLIKILIQSYETSSGIQFCHVTKIKRLDSLFWS